MPAAVRTTLVVLLAALGVVAGAALLTPPLHVLLVDWGVAAPDGFLKVLRRLLLIPGLVLLFAWLRPWRDGGPRSYGLLGENARPWSGLTAYGVTLGVGLAVLVGHFASGWLQWEDPFDGSKALARALRWVPMGLLVATLEEWFFRGWMDRRFRQRLGPAAAAVLVALVYAPLHAFKPSRLDVEVTHDVEGALRGLQWWLEHLVDLERFGPFFVGLFLLSLVLTAAWRRTRSLWVPIGVHAAGVTLLRSYGAFTDRSPPRTWAGSKELIDGPVLWVLLVAAAFLLSRRGGRPEADEKRAPGRL